MKVKHNVSGNEIECTEDHFNQVLSKQGWSEVKEEVSPAPKRSTVKTKRGSKDGE